MGVPVSSDSKTIGALLAWVQQTLQHAGISNPTQEAMWMLEHTLGLRRHQILSESDQVISPDIRACAESLASRRVAREPLQYLLGTQEFCGLEFGVSADVLIPRPETELLIQEVVRGCEIGPSSVIVDVGTGSGCLAVTLATLFRETRILAIDRSSKALAVAQRNAACHAVGHKLEWLEGDLLTPLRDKNVLGAVDVIVSNPPYIPEADWAGLQPEVRLFEPRMALIGGQAGTEFHERLLCEAPEYLSPGGMLMMEVGQGQAPRVKRIAQQVGAYDGSRVVEDAAGIERVVIVKRIG